MNVQFKKGVLELCVLALLTRQNRYGYDLVNEISKNIEISEGTIYPLLRRLKNVGQVGKRKYWFWFHRTDKDT